MLIGVLVGKILIINLLVVYWVLVVFVGRLLFMDCVVRMV